MEARRVRFSFQWKLRCAAWNSRRITRSIAGVCLLALWSAPGAAGDENPADEIPWFSGHVTASAWLASVEGNLQTPRGGATGTTDLNRPTTEEIDLDGLKVFFLGDVQLFVLRDHEFHFRIEWATLSGDTTLGKDLTSHGVFFPAGSKVDSQLDNFFGSFGYRAHWLPLKWSSGSLAPEVGVAVVNLHYQLDSASSTGSADREYSWVFPYLGCLVQQRINDRIDLEADIAGMAGINGATYASMDLRALYTVWHSDPIAARLVIGLAGTWLRRKDDQKQLQNDPDLRYGAFSSDPWAGVHFGLRVDF